MLMFGLLCFGAFSVLVEGQNMQYRPRPYRNRARPQLRQMAYNAPGRRRRPMNGGNSENEPFLPQNWRDLIQRNGGVHDVNDFINLLVTADGRQVVDSDIFSPYETADGKRVITGGGVMATSDECSPRNMSVRLPLNYSDNQIAYYPECTMVQRCGGCTPTQFLSCEPLYKENIVLKVLRARYLYPGALSMRWEGFSSVEVERHLSCRAVCNLQSGDCNAYQRFNPYQCKCVCQRSGRCYNEKVWDPELCRCRCPNERPCCANLGEEDDRTCTSYFDNDFCECTLKTSIGFSPNASQEEIDAWLESRRNRENQNNQGGGPGVTRGQYHVPPTTTTTTTTTTPAPTTRGNCRISRCPPNFQIVVNDNGNCVCVYGRGRRFRRH